MSQRLCLVAGWLTLAFIAFVTLSPIQDRPSISGPQLERFAAFALVGFLLARGYPSRLWSIIAVVVGSAFALELLQLLRPDRHAGVLDALMKAAGGLAGIGIGHLVPLLLRRRIESIRDAEAATAGELPKP